MTRYGRAFAVVLVLVAGCGARGVRTSAPLPVRVAAPFGARPPAPSTFWRVTTSTGASLTMEKYDAPGPGPHPTVVLFPGSPGWGTADEDAAAQWAAHGFTAVAVCWFRVSPVPMTGIDCPGGPRFDGVSARALPDVQALVHGVRDLPGVDPARIALIGFSRGGGMVALLATTGGREPVVAVNGLFDPTTFSGRVAGETDVIHRAHGIRAPVLLQYGRDDDFVPWQANTRRLADAIRQSSQAPEPEVVGYPGGHGIASDDVVDDEYRFLSRTLHVHVRTGEDAPAGAQYP